MSVFLKQHYVGSAYACSANACVGACVCVFVYLWGTGQRAQVIRVQTLPKYCTEAGCACVWKQVRDNHRILFLACCSVCNIHTLVCLSACRAHDHIIPTDSLAVPLEGSSHHMAGSSRARFDGDVESLAQ
eukprot:7570566-Alexandrium_andersonii.AAC.1